MYWRESRMIKIQKAWAPIPNDKGVAATSENRSYISPSFIEVDLAHTSHDRVDKSDFIFSYYFRASKVHLFY